MMVEFTLPVELYPKQICWPAYAVHEFARKEFVSGVLEKPEILLIVT